MNSVKASPFSPSTPVAAPAAEQHIYFVQNTETKMIRIGCAGSLKKRLSDMQVANHAELELLVSLPCEKAAEVVRDIEDAFARHRVREMWYRPDPAVLMLVEAARAHGLIGIRNEIGPILYGRGWTLLE